jgi:hypothetical protein
MHDPATRDAAALHEAEIAMFFAVLLAAMNFQMQAGWQNARVSPL